MRFGAHLDNLPEMLHFIQEKAKSSGFVDAEIRKIELASEEALVNIISYAYSGLNKNNSPLIEIDCEKNGTNRFEIVIKDRGIPFNPIDNELHVDIDRPIEERRIGGLGIFLIRQLMDEVVYFREGEENVLRMVLRARSL
jgi:serine/threonine-protein kinase RsbW